MITHIKLTSENSWSVTSFPWTSPPIEPRSEQSPGGHVISQRPCRNRVPSETCTRTSASEVVLREPDHSPAREVCAGAVGGDSSHRTASNRTPMTPDRSRKNLLMVTIRSASRGRLTDRRSAASRASAASGPSESEGGESAATPCWAADSLRPPFKPRDGLDGTGEHTEMSSVLRIEPTSQDDVATVEVLRTGER